METACPTPENPSREAMADCRCTEVKLREMIDEIAKEPDLGLRFEAGADLISDLVNDASLEGVQSAIHHAGQLLIGNRAPCYQDCFDASGHIGVDDLHENLPVERMCLLIALVKQSSVRKWLLTSLVACARHDVNPEAWTDQIQWFLRQAEGHVDWAPTVMGDVNFKVEMRPVEDAVALPPDAGAVH